MDIYMAVVQAMTRTPSVRDPKLNAGDADV